MGCFDDGPICWARDVHEAVQIAENLRREDRFDLFRGQIRNFKICPTILRPGVDATESMERFKSMVHWVHSTPELRSLHNDLDAIMAVAQHYGMATSLLDFTRSPKVAGFFASDGDPPHVDTQELEPSCIICLNRLVFEYQWKAINESALSEVGYDVTRIIEIDVTNLWRLDNQEGLFLHVKVDASTLESVTEFHRILFPYTGPLDHTLSLTMYPKSKSHLEGFLDQHLYAQKFADAIKKLPEVGYELVDCPSTYEGDPDQFADQNLPDCHPSWDGPDLDAWLQEPDEKYQDVISSIRITLQLEGSEVPSALSKRLKRQLEKDLKGSIRRKTVQWSILDEKGEALTADDEMAGMLEDDTYPQIECSRFVGIIYDGMRRLPYSNEQIAAAIANYIVFAVHGGWTAMEEMFGKILAVEFESGGARNRAFVSNQGIMESVRSDLDRLLSPEGLKRVHAYGCPAREVMMNVTDPSRLFVFSRFVDLFAVEIIPSQVVIGLEKDMILFSPARINAFGIS